MFSIGGLEWIVIIIVAFLVFGPDKLPQIAQSVGKMLRQFRAVQEQMTKTVQDEIYDPIKEDLDIIKSPFEEIKKPFEGMTLESIVEPSKEKATTTEGNDSATKAEKKPKAKKESNPETADAPTESFAERRARLEKEFAEKKASQKLSDLGSSNDSVQPGGQA